MAEAATDDRFGWHDRHTDSGEDVVHWDVYTVFTVLTGLATFAIAFLPDEWTGGGLSGRHRLSAFFFGGAIAIYGFYVAHQATGTYFYSAWIFVAPFLIVGSMIASARGKRVGPFQPGAPRRVQCPRCAELVASGALACRYCGAEYSEPLVAPHSAKVPTGDRVCRAEGCSEIGLPTERQYCDVCDEPTVALVPTQTQPPDYSADDVVADVRERLREGAIPEQLARDWRQMNEAHLITDDQLRVALEIIDSAPQRSTS